MKDTSKHALHNRDLIAISDFSREEIRLVLDQAARYADHIIALGSGGRIYRQGSPFEVVNPEMMRALFELECVVDIDDVTETPRVTPLPGRSRADGSSEDRIT